VCVVHVVFDRLDHDDGVVDDNADGQDHTEQGQGIDRKPEKGEGAEGGDERNRHRQHRYQGGAPALEEDKDNDQHQQERLEKGFHNLLERGHDKYRVVDDKIIGDIGGKAFRQLLQLGMDQARCLYGVGIGRQIDRKGRGIAAVVFDIEGV
jgi:hypothetical protein